MQFTSTFMVNPSALTTVGDDHEYEKAAVFQYWAERWAQPSESDPERRAALFARDLVWPLMTGTAALDNTLSSCGGSCPHLYSALKDFYIAAYAHAAPNVTPSQNAAFEFLDSELGNDGTRGQGQVYRDIEPFASDSIASGFRLDYFGQSLQATEGRIYEITIGPDISEIQARLTLTDSGFGQGLVWALVPFHPDGTADFARALLTADPSQLQTVEVTAGGRLAVVVVASQPVVPWDTNAVYDLQLDAPAIIGGGTADATEGGSIAEPLVTTESTSGGIVLLATPVDGRMVTVDTYPSDPAATVSVRRLAESGAEVSLGSYPGGATFDDGPLAAGRYLYEATADIGESSVTVYSQVVTVADDVSPPRAWLEVEGRAAETNDPTVRAFIGGLSEPVNEMRFAFSEVDLETATWVPFDEFTTVELTSGDGVYRVFGQVRDAAGLQSEVMVGEILLDTMPPQSTAGSLPATTATADITVPFTASDDGSFVNYLELWARHRPDGSSEWSLWTMLATPSISPTNVSLPFGEGQYEFYTVAVDGAGNREASPITADADIEYLADLPIVTERVSLSSGGGQGSSNSGNPFISDDGRYVTFESHAPDLVAGDTNGKFDIFVHDRLTDETTRISLASDGTQGDQHSYDPSISGDGRYVIFHSFASNLVAGDTNTTPDVFVHDRVTGLTERVSVASDGSQGTGNHNDSMLSRDGRYAVFTATSPNLVAGDTNGVTDIFVHDRQTDTTSRVSVASDGSQANKGSADAWISADGQYVAFKSLATNLTSGDTNGSWDVFVHDRTTGTTSRVSLASDGSQANGASGDPALSGDGRYVTFSSLAGNLVAGDANGLEDVFVHDRQTAASERVSIDPAGLESDGASSGPSLSDDGRYVAFQSTATNLVAGDTNAVVDVFVFDRQTATTTRWSVATDGTQANGPSDSADIAGMDGRTVAFDSTATNLVANDTNAKRDVFVRGPAQ